MSRVCELDNSFIRRQEGKQLDGGYVHHVCMRYYHSLASFSLKNENPRHPDRRYHILLSFIVLVLDQSKIHYKVLTSMSGPKYLERMLPRSISGP